MNRLAIGLVDSQHSTKMTLVLGRTMGENVTLCGVRTFDGAARANLKALARGFLCLHLRHFAVPS